MFQCASTLKTHREGFKWTLHTQTGPPHKQWPNTHPSHFSVWKIHQAFPVRVGEKNQECLCCTDAVQTLWGRGQTDARQQWLQPQLGSHRGPESQLKSVCIFYPVPASTEAPVRDGKCVHLLPSTCVFLNSFSSIFFSFLNCLKSWVCLTAASVFNRYSKATERGVG